MPVKEWFRKIQPVPVYVVLSLTIAFFIVELAVAHITHALTLLMDSYQMMCNIMALTGCIITIKYGNKQSTDQEPGEPREKKSKAMEDFQDTSLTKKIIECHDKEKNKTSSRLRANREKRLKNTFGWTRIDVITMLICCVFLASFSFSIYVEALQTLAHIDHQDEMHYPLTVLGVGAAGLILNGICYLIIGGYTFHQGSFLYVTESGDVVLNKVVVNESLQRGQRRLSRTRNIHSFTKQRQGLWEMTRDVAGCIFVMICAIVVFFTDPEIAKYVDPAFSLLSATTIMALSIPYIKESCFILLQTMPDSININSLKNDLITQFPDILNVHDFHIWQLTASKIVSTIHIIFENPKVYGRIIEDLKEFFIENGVTQVTIQPEFYHKTAEGLSSGKLLTFKTCLVGCLGEACKESHCCPADHNMEPSKFKTGSKEYLPVPEKSTPTLKSVRIMEDELPSLKGSISSFSINSLDSYEATKHHCEIDKRIDDPIAEEDEFKNDDNNKKPIIDENNDQNKVVKDPHDDIENIKVKESANDYSDTEINKKIDKKIQKRNDVEIEDIEEKEILCSEDKTESCVKDTHV